MSFTEWYKETQGEEWHVDYVQLVGFALEMQDGYFTYCHDNNLEPIWNG